jgi:hypothetical protein
MNVSNYQGNLSKPRRAILGIKEIGTRSGPFHTNRRCNFPSNKIKKSEKEIFLKIDGHNVDPSLPYRLQFRIYCSRTTEEMVAIFDPAGQKVLVS